MHSGTKDVKSYAAKRTPDKGLQESIANKLLLHENKIKNNFCISGFDHPDLPAFCSHLPYEPRALRWGLIPSWTKDEHQAAKIQHQTLNARIESIFEKPAFRNAARHQRCIIYADGFYEFHHKNKKVYPHYIHAASNDVIIMAGLCEQWTNPVTGITFHTTTIVTTKANQMMAAIHNNRPSEDKRMPLILSEETQNTWLDTAISVNELINGITPLAEDYLIGYPVAAINGKHATGNNSKAMLPFHYPELSPGLF
jgi:putative SOS response-associated peptidase YedK